MSSLKKNLVANYFGQVWTAIVALAFIPQYVRYLGPEAYGLVGLFAVFQTCLTFLDMGMTPTLTREMARFTAKTTSVQSIRDLLRSLEVICFSIAAAAALIVGLASHYLASDWLKPGNLPIETVAHALTIMAVVVALRFCEGIYRGSLIGLQRQVWFNIVNAVLATLRNGGVVGILIWVSPTVDAYFIWQGVVSLLTVAIFATKLHWSIPKPPSLARFRLSAVREVQKFAGGMTGIMCLALVLTQMDKVILSRILSLDAFGYYTLAATVTGALSMVVGPITQAIFPRMIELAAHDSEPELIELYHQSAQMVTVLTAPALMLLSFYAGGVVFLWSGSADLAGHVAPILEIFIIGTFVNGLMGIPYYYQMVYGWTNLLLKSNAIAVTFLAPAILVVAPRYGAVGTAWVWLCLNLIYSPGIIHFMHKRLLPGEKWRWYIADTFAPLAGSFAVGLVSLQFHPATLEGRLSWLGFLSVSGLAAFIVSALMSGKLRSRILKLLK